MSASQKLQTDTLQNLLTIKPLNHNSFIMSKTLHIGGDEHSIEIEVIRVKSIPGLLTLASLIYWERHGDNISHICPLSQALGKTARAVKYSPLLEGVVRHLEIVNTIDDVLDILSLPFSEKTQAKKKRLLEDLSEKCDFTSCDDKSLEKQQIKACKENHLKELQSRTSKVKNELLRGLLNTKTETDGLTKAEYLFSDKIKAALLLADELDEGIERRFTHAPDICHLLRVAAIAARLSHDRVDPEELEYRVCLALLHDCKENYKGEANIDQLIRENFGEDFGGRLLIDLEPLTKKKLPAELLKLVEKKLVEETGLDFSKESDSSDAKVNRNALRRLFRELSDSVYALGFETANEAACFVKLCDVAANAEDTNEEMSINPLRRLRALRGDGEPLLNYLKRLHKVIAERKLPALKSALDEAKKLLPEKPCKLPLETQNVVLAEKERQTTLQHSFFHALREVLEENKGAEWLGKMEESIRQAVPILCPSMEGDKNPIFWRFFEEIAPRR